MKKVFIHNWGPAPIILKYKRYFIGGVLYLFCLFLTNAGHHFAVVARWTIQVFSKLIGKVETKGSRLNCKGTQIHSALCNGLLEEAVRKWRQ